MGMQLWIYRLDISIPAMNTDIIVADRCGSSPATEEENRGYNAHQLKAKNPCTQEKTSKGARLSDNPQSKNTAAEDPKADNKIENRIS